MKIAIVTNILTPYRSYFYRELDAQLKKNNGILKVFVLTDELPLRPWKYEELAQDFTELVPGKKIYIKGEDFLINIKINKMLKLFSPDVAIIAGSWTYPTVWQILMNKLKGTEYYFWTESHNNRATYVGTSNLTILKIKKCFYKKFDGFCVPGLYANETVNYLVGNHGRRVHLPNLVDEQYYIKAISLRENKEQLREKNLLPKDKKVLICPARLIPIKGIDVFLKNAANVNRIGDIVFLIAGEGPERKKITEIANELSIDVRLLGYCDQNKIRELYALSDMFWLPSLQDANPLTSIEAAFSGLPLLVSRYTGNSPELVHDYENGIIFDTMEEDSVRRALNFIINADKSWFELAGRISYQIAMNGFQCSVQTEKLIDQFNDYKSS